MASKNNINSVFTNIANSIRTKKGTTNTIQPINMAEEIDGIPTGIEMPPVTNIQLSESGVLSWEFDSTSLSSYNPTITYIINCNLAKFSTTAKSYNLGGYLKEGSNEISIIVRAKLDHDGNANKDNYQYSLPAQYFLLLDERMPYTDSSRSIRVGNYVYLFYYKSLKIVKFNLVDKSYEILSTKMYSGNYSGGSYSLGVVGTNIYIFGRYSSGYRVDKFDTITETLTTLSVTMPFEKGRITCATLGTLLYFCGGEGTGSYQGVNVKKLILKFDTETETFTVLDVQLSGWNSSDCAVQVGEDIYICFGTIQKFNMRTETLTTLSPYLSIEGCYVVKDNYIYYFFNNSNSFQKYDIKNDTVSNVTNITQPRDVQGRAYEYEGFYYILGSRHYIQPYDSNYIWKLKL